MGEKFLNQPHCLLHHLCLHVTCFAATEPSLCAALGTDVITRFVSAVMTCLELEQNPLKKQLVYLKRQSHHKNMASKQLF